MRFRWGFFLGFLLLLCGIEYLLIVSYVGFEFLCYELDVLDVCSWLYSCLLSAEWGCLCNDVT